MVIYNLIKIKMCLDDNVYELMFKGNVFWKSDLIKLSYAYCFLIMLTHNGADTVYRKCRLKALCLLTMFPK